MELTPEQRIERARKWLVNGAIADGYPLDPVEAMAGPAPDVVLRPTPAVRYERPTTTRRGTRRTTGDMNQLEAA